MKVLITAIVLSKELVSDRIIRFFVKNFSKEIDQEKQNTRKLLKRRYHQHQKMYTDLWNPNKA